MLVLQVHRESSAHGWKEIRHEALRFGENRTKTFLSLLNGQESLSACPWSDF
jgi:hypothetical protein